MSSGFVVWLTGLSGAGKSTIAERLAIELSGRGRHVEILDGDEVRTHLSKGLGFSKEDRDTNVRRIGYVARLVARSGGVAITAAISPYREVRNEIRAQTPGFVEVFVRCPLDELVRRDVKGLYRRALAGEITEFTGISAPYEEPLHPEVVVDTASEEPPESVARIIDTLERLGLLPAQPRDRVLRGDEREAALEEARRLPRLEVDRRAFSDLYLLASGALAPLRGFVGPADYRAILDHGRLAGGSPFTIPVALRVAERPGGDRVALWHQGRPVGVVNVTDVFVTDPAREAQNVYGTTDAAHPGVALLHSDGTLALAGEVVAFEAPASGFPEYDLSPTEVRLARAERGWRTMVGFQTRNPVHRAHEYLQKVALELLDGLLLHPLVGETKPGDLAAGVRMRCYEALLEGYFPPGRALLATNPAWMRYAGPKEAVFHAIIRRNYGCTHFIVGRDHAGVGGYYDTYAAHRAFEAYGAGELGIEILRFENAFYCRACDALASSRTCPHGTDRQVTLSGTQVRELVAAGEPPPPEFTRPEIARILIEAARGEGWRREVTA